jgi:hypothetical protein
MRKASFSDVAPSTSNPFVVGFNPAVPANAGNAFSGNGESRNPFASNFVISSGMTLNLI